MPHRHTTKFDEEMNAGGKISYYRPNQANDGYSVYVTMPTGELRNFSNISEARLEWWLKAATEEEKSDAALETPSPPTRQTATDQQKQTEKWMFRTTFHEDYATKPLHDSKSGKSVDLKKEKQEDVKEDLKH
ncbi:hypothetical protein HK104_003239 [Borealophlyctis nickersoniae]|nr:hypothetical protein HK104_003239 [Borealophlyctis nickersoniae]